MNFEKLIPNKKPDEKVILFLRSHWIEIFEHYMGFAFMVAIPIAGYFGVRYLIPDFLTIPAIYAFLVLLISIYYLFALLLLYNSFIDYFLDVWIVTNKRIIGIEQYGLFHREVYEFQLENIQEVTAHQKGMTQTFLNYGDILIQTASAQPQTSLDLVANPFEVAKQIQQLLENQKTSSGNLPKI